MTPRAHMARIAAMPCLVCGQAATVHHVTATRQGVRITRSDFLTAPLCPVHHQIQHGPQESVEALGHGSFASLYGVDLLAWAYVNAPVEFRSSAYMNSLSGDYVKRSLGIGRIAA